MFPTAGLEMGAEILAKIQGPKAPHQTGGILEKIFSAKFEGAQIRKRNIP